MNSRPLGRRLLRWGMLATLLYAGFAAFAFFASERLIFQPPQHRSRENEAGASRGFVTTVSGLRIAILRADLPNAKRVILHSHGNAEDLSGLAPELTSIARHCDASVIAYDYPGYGESGGRPTERGTYEAIEAVHALLTSEGWKPDQIILYGRSLGAGPSFDLATHKAVGGLIAESAFVSAFRVITWMPVLPFDRFPNLERARTLSIPVLFIAGSRDDVVPPWHGELLFQSSPSPTKRLEVIADAGHNDLAAVAGPRYWAILEAFIRDLP
ncbi:MAG: alpha/beta hydrolase [Planctomycetes bacterium]|nr:alpha/beta hydrolase [Planctomycetota bacterium]